MYHTFSVLCYIGLKSKQFKISNPKETEIYNVSNFAVIPGERVNVNTKVPWGSNIHFY